MRDQNNLHEQLLSLQSISVEIAGLRDLGEIHDRALGLLPRVHRLAIRVHRHPPRTRDWGHRNWRAEVSDMVMDVAAIRGFDPDPKFYQQFRLMAPRSSVAGVVIREDCSHLTNDVDGDPHSVRTASGSPSDHEVPRRASSTQRPGYRDDRSGEQARGLRIRRRTTSLHFRRSGGGGGRQRPPL